MLERLQQAQVSIDWVVADTVYGNNLDLRTWLEEQGYCSVLAVANTQQVGIMTPQGPKLMTVKEAEQRLVSPQDWQRFSRANGHQRATLLRVGLPAHLAPLA
jgi:SRSO17 transposase